MKYIAVPVATALVMGRQRWLGQTPAEKKSKANANATPDTRKADEFMQPYTGKPPAAEL